MWASRSEDNEHSKFVTYSFSESDEEDLEILSTSEDSEDDVSVEVAEEIDPDPNISICKNWTFKTLFPDETYGITIKEPNEDDMDMYR